MSLKIQLNIREGWKATQNDRFGEVLEIRFVTEEGKIIFRYAPKLDDEHIFKEAFELLKEYDVKLKELKMITAKIEGRSYQGYGECNKNE